VRRFLTGLIFLIWVVPPAGAEEPTAFDFQGLEKRWAIAKYELTDKALRLAAVRSLHEETEALVQRHPGRAEPLIWRGIIFILEAEAHSNTTSLSALRNAKNVLEEALSRDPTALNGAAHANLGSLYYEVPGWPISFGNNRKAAEHLVAALQLDPHGREANYFYGDFLLQRGQESEALPYLEKALSVPIRSEHEHADRGRHKEVEYAYRKARQRLER
jgi:tetratricopeptide (TPR) repeat protein